MCLCTTRVQWEFVQGYGLISQVSPTILNEMYQFIDDESSVLPSTVSLTVQARLKLALELQNPDFASDFRKLNEGCHTCGTRHIRRDCKDTH